MLDPINVLSRMEVNTSGAGAAVRSYRDAFEANLTVDLARQHIEAITGVDYKFDDITHAKYTVLYVIDAILNSKEGERDYNKIVSDSFVRADSFLKAESNQWMFTSAEAAKAEATADVKVSDEATVQVQTTNEGKIKKGGKKVIALELYRETVLKEGTSANDFIKLLMERADMSEGGARTYYHICKKECA